MIDLTQDEPFRRKPTKVSLDFIGGRLRFFLDFWEQFITRDPWVLALVQGVKIDFLKTPPSSLSRKNPDFSSEDSAKLSSAVIELQNMQVVREIPFSTDLVVNPIFLVEHGQSSRLILNSKAVNYECVPYVHFKMDTLCKVLSCLKQGDWLVSHDLRKGYHNLALHPDHQRFFAFQWEDKHYVFQALPMGLREAPRLFTAVMKSLLAIPRALGWRVFSYIDDTLLAADSQHAAQVQSRALHNLLENAGFVVHQEKSVPEPTQRILFLGFIIDSTDLCVELPESKFRQLKKDFRLLREKIRNNEPVTIRKFAQIIGFVLSILPAVPYGEVHFRSFEFAKIDLLRQGNGWDDLVPLPPSLLPEIQWWLDRQKPLRRSFKDRAASHKVTTDASTSGGWGAICQDQKVGGIWAPGENNRIDVLEIRAVLHALRTLPFSWKNSRILLRIDNQVAVSYINNGGGKVKRLNSEARKIWEFLEPLGATMVAQYIPSRDNAADPISRLLSISDAHKLDAEWQLIPIIFNQLCTDLGVFPEIDWFASRENAQLSRFVSRFYQEGAWQCDAFECEWNSHIGLFFPPFCLLPRVVQRIVREGVKAILIHPCWPSNIWWPDIINNRNRYAPLPPIQDALRLPGFPELRHRLGKNRLQASVFNM